MHNRLNTKILKEKNVYLVARMRLLLLLLKNALGVFKQMQLLQYYVISY